MEAHSTQDADRSKVSVITPSLNHGKFLRENIEAVLHQTYKKVEHVIVDGGSTDDTISILKEYPHLKWISEKEEGDNGVLDAIWKAFYLSDGEYIVLSCVSDSLKDGNWFEKAVEILDRDEEVSHVWGLSQNLSEEGLPGKLWHAEFLEQSPPQKKDFLPFWLATTEAVECNAVFRRAIFETYYTKNTPDEPYRFAPSMGFNYHLNAQGYLPYFLPIITNFGRMHKDQRGLKYADVIGQGADIYYRELSRYKQDLLSGKRRHLFRNGHSQIIGELQPSDLAGYRKRIMLYRIKYSLKRKFERIFYRL
jgi:glycosyltransferase involved in cell wall biosynthesis